MSRWVDPQMQPILTRLKQAPGVDFRTMPVAEARPLVDAQTIPWSRNAPAIPEQDLAIPCGEHRIAARLYAPHEQRDGPVIIYVHGGGWTFGSIETHAGTMRFLAEASDCRVLGIDYRLAPEHPFPAPLEDVLEAIGFVERGGLGAPVAPGAIALAGDSAGANLALGALLARRDRGAPGLAGAALFYGCYAPIFETASHASFGDGAYLLTTVNMRWYWDNFLKGQAQDPGRHATPLDAELAGLPPLYLSAAGLDPLRDDTVLIAGKLAAAGVKLRFDAVPGVVHGCLRMAHELDAARSMIGAGAAFLTEQFDHTTKPGETTTWNAAISSS